MAALKVPVGRFQMVMYFMCSLLMKLSSRDAAAHSVGPTASRTLGRHGQVTLRRNGLRRNPSLTDA